MLLPVNVRCCHLVSRCAEKKWHRRSACGTQTWRAGLGAARELRVRGLQAQVQRVYGALAASGQGERITGAASVFEL